jgi:hypothetical protein
LLKNAYIQQYMNLDHPLVGLVLDGRHTWGVLAEDNASIDETRSTAHYKPHIDSALVKIPYYSPLLSPLFFLSLLLNLHSMRYYETRNIS